MNDQLLGVGKILLLLSLYLFFARVLWAVWNEVRPSATHPGSLAIANTPTISSESPLRVPRPYRVASMKVVSPINIKGLVIDIGTQPFSIGREQDNSMCIDDDTFASAHHAQLFRHEGLVTIKDLSSTNGTFVNTTRISNPISLKIGDRVQIGNVILEAIK